MKKIFAELKFRESLVSYLSNGQLLHSGPEGEALHAAVMHQATFFGRGNPLPAMVEVKKQLEKAQISIFWDNKPKTKLDRLSKKLEKTTSDQDRFRIMLQMEVAARHSPEAEWEIAKRMLEDGDGQSEVLPQ